MVTVDLATRRRTIVTTALVVLVGGLALASLGVGPNLIRIAHDHGVILRPVADSICFCPPLICTEGQISEMFKRFRAALAETQEWLKSQLVAA